MTNQDSRFFAYFMEPPAVPVPTAPTSTDELLPHGLTVDDLVRFQQQYHDDLDRCGLSPLEIGRLRWTKWRLFERVPDP